MSETDGSRPDVRATTPSATTAAGIRTAPPPRNHRPVFRTFIGVGMAALLIGAIVLALAEFHVLGTDPREAELTTLRAELQTLTARLATVEQSANSPKTETPSNDTAAQVGALESRLAAAENQIGRSADRDTLTALQDRLARLEKDAAGATLRRAATILAAANLARAAQAGADFRDELDALRTMAPDDPALAPLDTIASAGGAPTVAMLAASFPQLAREALQSDAEADTPPTVLGRFWNSIRRLVSIRRVGDVEGNTNADRLARAQAALDRGDLSGAVLETDAVEGVAAASMASWVKDAQARLTADRVISEMNKRVVQDLVLP